tara:strand:+ start:1372 stop:2064 length:693 start_codon:yes stop_codon:yes gene_type:complete
MNSKILSRLCDMFQASPQLMKDDVLLNQAVNGTFGVDIKDITFTNIVDLTNTIDYNVLKKYFTTVWQPITKKYKYSGLSIVDEVNNLKPLRVLDLGCGYNEFKGKINNLIGIDPYNNKADIQSSILDYKSQEQFDVVISLGSINFGTVDKIYAELENAVNLTKPNGLLYFRVNPGEQHKAPEAQWIQFFNWTSEFIINSSSALNCSILKLEQEVNDRGTRYYFVLRKNDK